MGNMYYTFDYKYGFHPYTIKDISSMIAQYNPVQLVIDDNFIWDDKYNDSESYNKAIEEFADKQVKELWISFTNDNKDSLIKITTWEHDNGT